MRRHGRGVRVARGAVAASVATFIALLSHVTAGGAVPGAVGVVVPLALSFVVCVGLAGRRVSAWRLSASVVVSQALFHALFVLGSFDLASARHAHGAAVAVVTGPADPPIAMDAAMWIGHAVAALLTTVALHRGERTVTAARELAARCSAWMRARARVASAAPGPARPRRVFAVAIVDERPSIDPVVRSTRRRGPPAPASLLLAPLV